MKLLVITRPFQKTGRVPYLVELSLAMRDEVDFTYLTESMPDFSGMKIYEYNRKLSGDLDIGEVKEIVDRVGNTHHAIICGDRQYLPFAIKVSKILSLPLIWSSFDNAEQLPQSIIATINNEVDFILVTSQQYQQYLYRALDIPVGIIDNGIRPIDTEQIPENTEIAPRALYIINSWSTQDDYILVANTNAFLKVHDDDSSIMTITNDDGPMSINEDRLLYLMAEVKYLVVPEQNPPNLKYVAQAMSMGTIPLVRRSSEPFNIFKNKILPMWDTSSELAELIEMKYEPEMDWESFPDIEDVAREVIFTIGQSIVKRHFADITSKPHSSHETSIVYDMYHKLAVPFVSRETDNSAWTPHLDEIIDDMDEKKITILGLSDGMIVDYFEEQEFDIQLLDISSVAIDENIDRLTKVQKYDFYNQHDITEIDKGAFTGTVISRNILFRTDQQVTADCVVELMETFDRAIFIIQTVNTERFTVPVKSKLVYWLAQYIERNTDMIATVKLYDENNGLKTFGLIIDEGSV